MSGYLFAFILAVVLHIASVITTCYFKYCLGKRYELMSGISEILHCAVFLTFSWWLLEQFFSGFDSGFGWWLISAAIGLVISVLIRIATEHLCKKTWFKDKDVEITTIKAPKVLITAIYVFTFIVCVGFTILFIYCLFANVFDGTGKIIMVVLAIALFAFGSYDGMKKIIRQCKK